MTEIYLIRHAEAEGNLYRFINGQYNSNVTYLGKKQAVELAKRFEKIDLSAVYSSDLQRAMYTAEQLAKLHNIKVIPCKELREINMGLMENMPWTEALKKFPEQTEKFVNKIEEFNLPGAETAETVKKRILNAVLDITEQHYGEKVVIVSHGTALSLFLSSIEGIILDEFKKKYGSGDNTCVTLIEYEDEKFNILYCNDNSHLTKELSTYERQKHWRSANKICDVTIRKKKRGNSFFAEAIVGDIKIGRIVINYDKDKYFFSFCHVEKEYRNKRVATQLFGYLVNELRERKNSYIYAQRYMFPEVFLYKLGFQLSDNGTEFVYSI